MRAKQHQQQHQQQQPTDENQLPLAENSIDRQQAEPDCHVTVDDDTPVMSSDDDDEVEMSNDDTTADSEMVLSDNCLSTSKTALETATCESGTVDDSMTSDDVRVAAQDDTIVAKQQQLGNWANNRRRKNSRPQWHYEGTVLDRSQRADVTDASAATAAAADPATTSAQTASEHSSSQIDAVSLPLLIADSSGGEITENLCRKTTGHHEFTKTDIKSELVVAAGCDGWR
jgi:hypothetical protein